MRIYEDWISSILVKGQVRLHFKVNCRILDKMHGANGKLGRQSNIQTMKGHFRTTCRHYMNFYYPQTTKLCI